MGSSELRLSNIFVTKEKGWVHRANKDETFVLRRLKTAEGKKMNAEKRKKIFN